MKAVPAVKYALGVAGVAAAVAIIEGFKVDYKVAVLGTVIMFGLMFVLVIFSDFSRTSKPSLKPLSLTLAWTFAVLLVATSLFIFTGFFFSWPRPLDEIADRVTGSRTASPTLTPSPSPDVQPSPAPAASPTTAPSPASTQTPTRPDNPPRPRGQDQSTPAIKRPSDHVGRARSLYEQGRYQEAISECDRALQANPGDSEAAALKRRIARTVEILNRQ